MLILNRLQAHNKVYNNRAVLKVRSSNKTAITPHSGIVKNTTMTGYSSRLKYFL